MTPAKADSRFSPMGHRRSRGCPEQTGRVATKWFRRETLDVATLTNLLQKTKTEQQTWRTIHEMDVFRDAV
jgi:hypothetical protein